MDPLLTGDFVSGRMTDTGDSTRDSEFVLLIEFFRSGFFYKKKGRLFRRSVQVGIWPSQHTPLLKYFPATVCGQC